MSKLKKLILHIGTEKTGTTSLQGFLRKNKLALAEQGVGLLGAPKRLNNHEVAAACQSLNGFSQTFIELGLQTRPQREAWQADFRSDVRREIQSLPVGIHTVIVSCELLHSRIRTLEDVDRVRSLFEGLFETIQVLVYLRRQDRVAVSLYSTLLRGGSTSRHVIRPGIKAGDPYYDYERLLEKWAAVFGDGCVAPRIFDRQRFSKADLVSDFLETVGLSHLDDSLERPDTLNESISAEVAEVLIHFNQAVREPNGDQLGQNHHRLRAKLIGDLMKKFPAPPLTCTRDQARTFYRHFSAGNLSVAQRWFSGQPLFDDDFSQYPDRLEPAVPSPAMLGETLRVIFAQTGATARRSPLVSSLRGLSPLPKDEFALLRQLAQSVEAHDPLLALYFARQALRLRPEGPAIKRLVEKLRKLPGAATCEAAWAGPPAAG